MSAVLNRVVGDCRPTVRDEDRVNQRRLTINYHVATTELHSGVANVIEEDTCVFVTESALIRMVEIGAKYDSAPIGSCRVRGSCIGIRTDADRVVQRCQDHVTRNRLPLDIDDHVSRFVNQTWRTQDL